MRTKSSLRLIRLSLLLGTLVSLYFVPWPILKAYLQPLPDGIQEQVEKCADYGFDAVIVYIDETGREPKLFSSGTISRVSELKPDSNTLFKIASVGKLHHALAVAKLVSSGQLNLDSSLAFYLPELAGRIQNASIISLRNLVQHRSGIPNYTDTHLYWMSPEKTWEENLALVLDKQANFLPDAKYEYCNTNYLLIERIIERITKISSQEYISKAILKPLGLHHTFFRLEEVNIEQVMSGYYVGYEQDLKQQEVGSMLATAPDLARFIRALNDGSAFDNTNEKEIYTSLYRFGHTGLIPGYQSQAHYHKDFDAVIIQFTNTVDFEGYNWSLSEAMYRRVCKIQKRLYKKSY